VANDIVSGRRSTDEPTAHPIWRKFVRENWYRDVWLFVITCLMLATLAISADTSDEASRASGEAKKIAVANRAFISSQVEVQTQRRDEQCRFFEQQESASFKRVIASYKYLDDLPRRERHTPLTRAIVRALPDTYKEASASRAPSYCDEPGIGLPEPGPRLPKQRTFKGYG